MDSAARGALPEREEIYRRECHWSHASKGLVPPSSLDPRATAILPRRKNEEASGPLLERETPEYRCTDLYTAGAVRP